MTFDQYLAAIRRRFVPALLVVLVVSSCGTALVLAREPRYTSVARSYISVASAARGSAAAQTGVADLTQASAYAETASKSFATLAGTALVLQRVIAALHLDETVANLANDVKAAPEDGTAVLDVSVTRSSPTQAAAIANAVVGELNTQADALAAPDPSVLVRVVQIEPARPALAPSSPKLPLDFALILLTGIAAALLVIAGLEAWRPRVSNIGRLRALSRAPVVLSIERPPTARLSSRTGSGRAIAFAPSDIRPVGQLVTNLASDGTALVMAVCTSVLPGVGAAFVDELVDELRRQGWFVSVQDQSVLGRRRSRLGRASEVRGPARSDVGRGQVSDLDTASEVAETPRPMVTKGGSSGFHERRLLVHREPNPWHQGPSDSLDAAVLLVDTEITGVRALQRTVNDLRHADVPIVASLAVE